MEANFQNLLYFIGRLAPMIMVFFFVFASIINMDWKGFIYLSGIIFACFSTILFSNSMDNLFSTDEIGSKCKITEKEFSKLPLSCVILGFTITYLFLPMIKTYGNITNFPLFLCFLLFVIVDVIFLINNNCSKFNISFFPIFFNILLPIIVAYAIGAMISTIFVVVLSSTNNGSLLYYGQEANGLCKKKDKKFACKVYKNGELLTT